MNNNPDVFNIQHMVWSMDKTPNYSVLALCLYLGKLEGKPPVILNL